MFTFFSTRIKVIRTSLSKEAIRKYIESFNPPLSAKVKLRHSLQIDVDISRQQLAVHIREGGVTNEWRLR